MSENFSNIINNLNISLDYKTHLNNINSMLNNPYYAQIMRARGIKI